MSSSCNDRYDLLIIGARCAGATFATLAARAGARVLLVDRAPLPSDLVLSTHTLHPSGARVLDRIGVGARLRAATPSLTCLRIGRRAATLDVRFSGDDAEFCPRRSTLDALVQEAAREAGAHVVERITAKELSIEAGRVCGALLSDRDARERRVRADLVVGADGKDSFVARAVGARTYLDYEAPRVVYWSYWAAPSGYGRPGGDPGMYVVNRAGVVRIAFLTENDQVLVGSAPGREHAPAFRRDPLGALRADLQHDERLAALTSAPPLEKVRGYVPSRYFLRDPVGPGWLLLGDAGIHQDFVTGNGMSEAFAQAESASRALLAGAAALDAWHGQRDASALPMYFFGKLQGAAGAPSRLDERVLAHAARTPALAERFARSLAGELSPLEVVPLLAALRCVFAGTLRGELGLVRQLVRRRRVMAELEREREQSRALFARVAGVDRASVAADGLELTNRAASESSSPRTARRAPAR